MAIEITGRINFDSSDVDEATQSVGELKNEVNQLGESSGGISKVETNLSLAKDSAELLAGSVTAVIGGLALLGIENKYIENLTQGAVGAIAFGQGVAQAGEAAIRLSKNQKVAAVTTKAVTIAQKAFNVAAKANPYILAAALLIGVVSAFAALAVAIKDSAKESALANTSATELAKTLNEDADAADRLNLSLQDQADIFQLALEEAEKKLIVTQDTENSLRLQGLSEEDILDLKLEQLKAVITTQEAQIATARQALNADVEQQQRYKDLLANLLAPVKLVGDTTVFLLNALSKVGLVSKQTVEDVQKSLDDTIDSSLNTIFDPEQTRKDGEAVIAESENALLIIQNKADGFELTKIANEKAARDKRKAARDKEQAELDKAAADKEAKDIDERVIAEDARLAAVQLIKDNEQSITNFLTGQKQIRLDAKKTERQLELEQIQTDFDAKLALVAGNEELLAKLRDEQKTQEEATNKKFDASDLATKKANADVEAAIAEKLAQDKINAQRSFLDTTIQFAGEETALGKTALIAKQVLNAKELVDNAQKTLSNIALKSAESGTDISVGFAKTLSAGFPQNIPLLIGFGVQAISIGAAIAKAVKASKATVAKVPGASSAGASSASSSATVSSGPNVNFFGQGGNNTNQAGEDEAIESDNQSTAIQAFVSETDLKRTTGRLNNIREGAEL